MIIKTVVARQKGNVAIGRTPAKRTERAPVKSVHSTPHRMARINIRLDQEKKTPPMAKHPSEALYCHNPEIILSLGAPNVKAINIPMVEPKIAHEATARDPTKIPTRMNPAETILSDRYI